MTYEDIVASQTLRTMMYKYAEDLNWLHQGFLWIDPEEIVIETLEWIRKNHDWRYGTIEAYLKGRMKSCYRLLSKRQYEYAHTFVPYIRKYEYYVDPHKTDPPSLGSNEIDDAHEQRQIDIEVALQTLTDKQRNVVRSIFWEGLTYDEIAKRSGVRFRASVCRVAKQSIEKLKPLLQQYAKGLLTR